MTFPMPVFSPVVAAGGVTPITVTHIDSQQDGTDGTDFDYTVDMSSFAAGDVAVVVSCHARRDRDLDTVTIGGETGTARLIVHGAQNGNRFVEISTAVMGASPTDSVSLTYTGGDVLRHGISVYRLQGATEAPHATDQDDIGSGTDAMSGSVAVEEGGCIIAGSCVESGTARTHVWSLANEAVDTAIESNDTYSTAWEDGFSAATENVSVTLSGNPGNGAAFGVASFSPS